MFFVVSLKNSIKVILACLVVSFLFGLSIYNIPAIVVSNEVDVEIAGEIENIFKIRDNALLENDIETIKSLFDLSTKYGTWAFTHEQRKVKYLNSWSDKQGVKFTGIKSRIVVRSLKDKGEKYTANVLKSTEYEYVYENAADSVNMFRIGTSHSIDIIKNNDTWLITKEWYTDPFADSLNLDNIKTEEIKQHILSKGPRDFSKLNERRIAAVEYADKYCGSAADEEYGLKYNKKYRNYNPLGGDCANFASQILFEGGKFRKTGEWNYHKGGSKAWVNAQAFKNFWLWSGRASLIASGSYEKVVKASYKLLPGDFVAYEKKGEITHISVVTGADSKGYPLVNCHNIDRYRVPWDLGWSNKGIKFWLVRVHF
jgi:hypothetical protein